MKGKIFRVTLIMLIILVNNISLLSAEETEVKISNINVAVSTQKAKEIAFSHSKMVKSAARITKLMLYKEKGKYFYDIEFFTSTKKYIYRIDANTGDIIEHSQKNRTKKQTGGFKISIFGL